MIAFYLGLQDIANNILTYILFKSKINHESSSQNIIHCCMAIGIQFYRFCNNRLFYAWLWGKSPRQCRTSIAQFQDALTIANNPAGLSWIGNRIDIGATVFSPDRSAEITANQMPKLPTPMVDMMAMDEIFCIPRNCIKSSNQ
jgi:hypothetical protein